MIKVNAADLSDPQSPVRALLDAYLSIQFAEETESPNDQRKHLLAVRERIEEAFEKLEPLLATERIMRSAGLPWIAD